MELKIVKTLLSRDKFEYDLYKDGTLCSTHKSICSANRAMRRLLKVSHNVTSRRTNIKL